MARHKEFDIDHALEQAMCVFWRQGYDGTSIQDLVDAMGIGRSSLYDTFGDKDSLFAQALERYATRTETEVLAPLREHSSSRAAIEALFAQTVDRLSGESRDGCMLVKTALATWHDDSVVAQRNAQVIQRFEDALHETLVRAQAQGEIGAEKKPRALARFLNSTLQGLNVAASAGKGRRALNETARLALSILD